MYVHENFEGEKMFVDETEGELFEIDDSRFYETISSIEVRQGCIFKLFGDPHGNQLLGTYTDDDRNLGSSSDRAKTYRCSCGKFIVQMWGRTERTTSLVVWFGKSSLFSLT